MITNYTPLPPPPLAVGFMLKHNTAWHGPRLPLRAGTWALQSTLIAFGCETPIQCVSAIQCHGLLPKWSYLVIHPSILFRPAYKILRMLWPTPLRALQLLPFHIPTTPPCNSSLTLWWYPSTPDTTVPNRVLVPPRRMDTTLEVPCNPVHTTIPDHPIMAPLPAPSSALTCLWGWYPLPWISLLTILL